MKILLCAVNSKYIHSSLSIRCLYSYAYEYKEHIELIEFTINNSTEHVLKEIYMRKPDVLCFSCYIWNIEFIKEICGDILLILPQVKIILGGPEVSFPPYNFEELNAHIICIGEGELTFTELVKEFVGGGFLENINGIAYYKNGEVRVNPTPAPINLNDLPFVYGLTEIPVNKIIYYESSRGCPYKCSYCLSSKDNGVRYMAIERVYKDIDFFLNNMLRQVKFVDRTFNCSNERAFYIWEYIINNDNGFTNFHFEIGADLLNDSQIELLAKARAGLIQFEAGVQSTNEETNEAVLRKTDISKLFKNVSKIKALGNIHLHLDLIAGLPGEDYTSFKNSFNDVFSYRPDMLQLGFLKLLKGSPLREAADLHGIVYRRTAPYEVLYTNELNYHKILLLKSVENLLEQYYNSGLFAESVEYAVGLYNTPFDFFEAFSKYWEENHLFGVSHTKQRLFELLYEFAQKKDTSHAGVLSNLLKFDMFMNENAKKLPEWVEITDYKPIKGKINLFFSNSENCQKYYPHLQGRSLAELARICHIEKFTLDISKWRESRVIEYCDKYYLFVYHSRNDKTSAYEIEL